MILSYGQLFRLFSDLLHLNEEKSTALTGRLKHFQRAGFPNGTNVGPGLRAVYGAQQVFALAFAFRLLALRYSPKDAAAAVEGSIAEIDVAVLRAWTQRERGSTWVADGPTLVRVVADGLEDLRREDFADGPPDRIVIVDQRQVWAWLRGVDEMPGAGIVVLDVDALVADVLETLERLGIASSAAIAKGRYLLEMSCLASGLPTPLSWDH